MRGGVKKINLFLELFDMTIVFLDIFFLIFESFNGPSGDSAFNFVRSDV